GAGDVERLMPAWFIPVSDYDPVTNPRGTVVWRLDADRAVDATFQIYFDITEHGTKPGAPASPPVRDLIVRNSSEPFAYTASLGSDVGLGAFAEAGRITQTGDGGCFQMAVADLDHDGDLDLVGSIAVTGQSGIGVMLQNPDGTFADAVLSASASYGTWLEL